MKFRKTIQTITSLILIAVAIGAAVYAIKRWLIQDDISDDFEDDFDDDFDDFDEEPVNTETREYINICPNAGVTSETSEPESDNDDATVAEQTENTDIEAAV